MTEFFLTCLHFNDPETQLKWLYDLHNRIIPEAIEEFKEDFGLKG